MDDTGCVTVKRRNLSKKPAEKRHIEEKKTYFELKIQSNCSLRLLKSNNSSIHYKGLSSQTVNYTHIAVYQLKNPTSYAYINHSKWCSV